MNEEMINRFCDYLENIDLINYTDVWVMPSRNDLYGRTFTPTTKDRHRIEIYKNDTQSNEDILCHELAHVILYKMNKKQNHEKEFEKAKKLVINLLHTWKLNEHKI